MHIDSGDPNKIDELVSKLVEVDWRKEAGNRWMQSQAGFAGQKELYEMLYRWVYLDIHPDHSEADQEKEAVDTAA